MGHAKATGQEFQLDPPPVWQEQVLEASSAASQTGELAGSLMGSRAGRTRVGIAIWDTGIQSASLTSCTTALAPKQFNFYVTLKLYVTEYTNHFLSNLLLSTIYFTKNLVSFTFHAFIKNI